MSVSERRDTQRCPWYHLKSTRSVSQCGDVCQVPVHCEVDVEITVTVIEYYQSFSKQNWLTRPYG